MDCEKAEPLLIDELYDELDDVTSAAVKRHVAGCTACAAALEGMRSTSGRARSALAIEAVPAGLEDRILSAVKEAQKVVPIQSRLARAVSWAGSWAARPQTAMAAVFLLMIGTSAFVIRSQKAAAPTAAVSVTEQGAPRAAAPSPQPNDQGDLDDKASAAAHGPHAIATTHPPPPAATAPLALNEEPAAGLVNGSGTKGGRAANEKADDPMLALGGSAEGVPDLERAAEKKSATATGAAPPSEGAIANAAAPAGAPPAYAQSVAPSSPAARGASGAAQDGFAAGMAAYRARNFAEAIRQFDTAARSGDQNAALWAAKSVKDGGSCAGAIPRFDAVTRNAAGTWHGHEAELETARCQIAAGQLAVAREKLDRLAHVPSHAAGAEQALGDLNRVASRMAAERARQGGGSARPAAAAPRAAPAPPPAKPAQPRAPSAAEGL